MHGGHAGWREPFVISQFFALIAQIYLKKCLPISDFACGAPYTPSVFVRACKCVCVYVCQTRIHQTFLHSGHRVYTQTVQQFNVDRSRLRSCYSETDVSYARHLDLWPIVSSGLLPVELISVTVTHLFVACGDSVSKPMSRLLIRIAVLAICVTHLRPLSRWKPQGLCAVGISCSHMEFTDMTRAGKPC